MIPFSVFRSQVAVTLAAEAISLMEHVAIAKAKRNFRRVQQIVVNIVIMEIIADDVPGETPISAGEARFSASGTKASRGFRRDFGPRR